MKKVFETIVLGVTIISSIVRAVLCLLGCIFTIWLVCSFAEVIMHNDEPNYNYSDKNIFVIAYETFKN